MLPVCRLSEMSASAGGSCGPGNRDVTSDACHPMQVIVCTRALVHDQLQLYSTVRCPARCGHLNKPSMLGAAFPFPQ